MNIFQIFNITRKCTENSVFIEGHGNKVIIDGEIRPKLNKNCINSVQINTIPLFFLLGVIIIILGCCYCLCCGRRGQANREKYMMHRQQQIQEQIINN